MKYNIEPDSLIEIRCTLMECKALLQDMKQDLHNSNRLIMEQYVHEQINKVDKVLSTTEYAKLNKTYE